MDSKSKERIFGLDLMRAIAIILVVFSHSSWFFPSLDGIAFTLINYAGLFGVEIFFVLSGFLIGRILYRLFVSEEFSKSKIFSFLKRRWLRTIPNYYLILILNIILGYFLYQDLPFDIWKYFLFIQNFWSEQTPFFYESWSLSIEEFAYVIAPLILYLSILVSLKVSKRKLFLYSAILVVLIFAIIRLNYHFSSESFSMLRWTTGLKSVVIYRVDAIFYGFIAAYFSINNLEKWVKNKNKYLIYSVFVFIGFNFLMSTFGKSNQLIWNVFYLPINSIAIVFSLPFFSNIKLQEGIFYKAITFVSVISYSIYLLHYSIIMKLYIYFIPTKLSTAELILTILTYLILTLLFSYVLYQLFEKPMMNFGKRVKTRE